MRALRAILFGLALAGSAAGQDGLPLNLGSVAKPGATAAATQTAFVLADNLAFPQKVVFQGLASGLAVPILSREETDARAAGKGTLDRLETRFSGRIYSQHQEFFRFEDLTGLQLIGSEPVIAPLAPGIPTGPIWLDLTVRATSHDAGSADSDDAGIYAATLIITLISL